MGMSVAELEFQAGAHSLLGYLFGGGRWVTFFTKGATGKAVTTAAQKLLDRFPTHKL